MDSKVGRLRYAQPVCPPGFVAMIPPVQTPIAGLQIADTCFYYPEDRGISESVRYGRIMARAIDDPRVWGGAALMSGEFVRFLSTGGFAAAVNLCSRYQLNKVLSFEIAVALSYLFGMVTAYVLARVFVFQASGRSVVAEFKRFAIINVFSLVLVWSISVALARHLFPAIGFRWHADDIAHFIGVAAPAVVSYFGHRAYTFAPTMPEF